MENDIVAVKAIVELVAEGYSYEQEDQIACLVDYVAGHVVDRALYPLLKKLAGELRGGLATDTTIIELHEILVSAYHIQPLF